MTILVDRDVPTPTTSNDTAAPVFPALRPTYCLLAAPIAAALAVAGAAVAVVDDPLAVEIVRPGVIVLWAVAGLVLGVRRRHDRLAPIVLAGSIVGAVGSLAATIVEHQSLDGGIAFAWDLALRVSAALLPAIGMHLLFGLADGRLATPIRQRAVFGGYVVSAAVGVAGMAERDRLVTWPNALLWVAAVGFGLYAANVRYVKATAIDRRRMQWVGWGMAVATEAAIVIVALRLLTDWPDHAPVVALGITALVPLALTLGTLPTMVARVDRLLTHTVAIAGLTALVVAVYVVVVLGLGRTPTGSERGLLLLSMAAAGLCALVYLPARRRLTERANRLVYGERVSPDELLRTFGQRLTRSIPMDELLLQLTESLRKSMVLQSAEVWTGQNGHLELAAGVPHRQPDPISIGPKETPVVARAGVSGGTWLEIWLPAIIGAGGSAAMRVAPVAHGGELLGLITVTRPRDGEPFTEAEDRVLTELARQVALALHNVQLDTALQASLEELQVRNAQLQESRARIVAAGDAERRKLERNLHDGAQQHLVALAVKLRLTRDAVEDDPADAIAMIDEIKGNLQDAIQELRSLAHGIFPPLLVSGGLAEALPAAATRAALPVTVDTAGIGRYAAEMEAAIYFCVLEALQNAGKHAGDGATVRVTITERDGTLGFEVSDDGAGFDAAAVGDHGHGFVNMADRLGAFGGTLAVRSAPGAGATIAGSLPLPAG
ncbi:MAG TPA: histidine kinase [Ilumatobacteraceae bacterium]|nr:histidine kinase [Ilumatobacteraceae bacterium]